MMTREEAIKWLEEIVQDTDTYWESCSKALQKELYEQKQVFLLALSALRPITREKVEKMWGSGGWETVPDKGFVDTAGRQVYHLHCPHCGFFWRETGHAKYFRFCPHCGAPMTNEAVEMVMERLEAMKGEAETN